MRVVNVGIGVGVAAVLATSNATDAAVAKVGHHVGAGDGLEPWRGAQYRVGRMIIRGGEGGDGVEGSC